MKKKIIICAAVSAMMFGSVSFAASTIDSLSYDVPSKTLRVSGISERNKSYDLNMVTIEVLRPGVTPEKLKEMDDFEKKNAVAFVSQVKMAEDGAYSFVYSPKSVIYGNHNIYVTDPNGEVIYKSVLFTDSEKNNELLSDINSASTAELAKAALEKHSYLLDGVKSADEIQEKYPDKDIIGSIAAMMAGKKYEDAQQVTEYAVKCAVISAVNLAADKEEFKSFLDKYKTEIGFDENKIYTDLFLSFADSIADEFINKNYKDPEAFEENFNDSVIIAKFNNLKNYSGVPAILDAGRAWLKGFDFDRYDKLTNTQKASVQKELITRAPYTSVEEINKVFNDSVKNPVSQNNTPGGGGGGGGGTSSSSSTSGAAISAPNLTNPSKEDKPAQEKNIFDDIDSVPWARESITALYSKGIINGMSDGKFEPNAPVTREQFIKMIVCAYGLENADAKCSFEDVRADSWYYGYIASACEKGIVNGISDELFGAGRNITREDMAVMAYRTALSCGASFKNGAESFADDENIYDYAKDAVNALKSEGIMSGKDNNLFAPKDYATRAEAAKIIYGLIGLGGKS
ncbi:MAG: S-layer homology domain-containing protein [Clostridiales bacterium]|nr:S-layer homology domain-containing protein [Clostridiales bacterium]